MIRRNMLSGTVCAHVTEDPGWTEETTEILCSAKTSWIFTSLDGLEQMRKETFANF